MNRILVVSLAVALGLALPAHDAEAKRLSSGGVKRSMPAQNTPPAHAAPAPQQSPGQQVAPQQAAKPAVPAAAAAPAKRSWLGPLAGLAAGLGLAALASHFGFGGGLANIMTLLLVGLVIAFVVRWAMRRFASPRPELAGAGGPSLREAEPAPESFTASNAGGTAQQPLAAAASPLPADFDAAGFEKLAKQVFIRMQAANDAGDQADLRRFTTPQMYAHIQQELLERAGKVQRTDVLQLDAQVVEVTTEHGEQVVSVRFSGLVREESEQAATAFDEFWHLVRAPGQEAWAIAGIQDTATA